MVINWLRQAMERVQMNVKLRFAILLMFVCFMVSPIRAQEATPTPRPSTTTVLTEISDAVQSIGIFNFVAAGVIILVVIVAWQGLKPLIQSNIDANRRAGEAQAAMIEAYKSMQRFQEEQSKERNDVNETRRLQAESLRQSAESQAQTTEAQKEQIRIMKDIETRTEAQQSRTDAVGVVNEHTTTTINNLKTTLDTLAQQAQRASEGIETLKHDLTDKVDQKALDDALKPITDKLVTISSDLATVRESVSLIAISVNVESTDPKKP